MEEPDCLNSGMEKSHSEVIHILTSKVADPDPRGSALFLDPNPHLSEKMDPDRAVDSQECSHHNGGLMAQNGALVGL